MSSLQSEDNFFDLEINPKEEADEKKDPSIEDIKNIIDRYKNSPYYLKEEEATIMYDCYMSSHILKKYGATENIARFLECHKTKWRQIWNQIHEQQNELQVELQAGENK